MLIPALYSSLSITAGMAILKPSISLSISLANSLAQPAAKLILLGLYGSSKL